MRLCPWSLALASRGSVLGHGLEIFCVLGLEPGVFDSTPGQHNNRASLLIHFQSWHTELMNSLPDILDCFEVIFIQELTNQQKLDVLESVCKNKLVAEININKTILPKYH